MKTPTLLAILFPFCASAAYTEFYCEPNASNLNAGSTTNEAAIFTFTSGNWTNATGWFFASGADLSAITTQMWASVYPDGSSVAVFVGRITNVDDTLDNIGVSGAAKSGTKPTDGTGTRSIKIGGAWKGPNAASGFPISLVQGTMTNVNGDVPRVNLKAVSGTNYTISAAISRTATGPIVFQGYTTTPGDGGMAIINGGTAGASHNLLSMSGGGGQVFADLIFATNGATGLADGIYTSASQTIFRRCVFHDLMGNGIFTDTTFGTVLIECEAYACNTSNTADSGGFKMGNASQTLIRCISHDNSTAEASGFVIGSANGAGNTLIGCIADSNGSDGFRIMDSPLSVALINCDSYNNASNGVRLITTSADESSFYLENCNFVKNAGQGIHINGPTNQIHTGYVVNCGFGSGTQTNSGGNLSVTNGLTVIGTVTYAADTAPWLDPANGDFRVNLSTAQGDGRGTFLQTAGGSGTVGFPDIGAAQHLDVGGAGSGTTYLFVQ